MSMLFRRSSAGTVFRLVWTTSTQAFSISAARRALTGRVAYNVLTIPTYLRQPYRHSKHWIETSPFPADSVRENSDNEQTSLEPSKCCIETRRDQSVPSTTEPKGGDPSPYFP